MKKIAGPDFDAYADYDSFVQAIFKDVEDFVHLTEDPFYIETVNPDHANFAAWSDLGRCFPTKDEERRRADDRSMTVGWVEDHVADGKVVN
jgi:hypothetical protein